MKIKSQRNPEMQELADCLEGQRTAMLTLGDSRGSLGARPLTPMEMDEQGAIWFLVSRSSMAALVGPTGSPVNLSFSDTDKSLFVSIAGAARLDEDSERKARLWSSMARPWFSGPDDPDLSLLCVSAAAIDVWDGPDSSVVRALAMVASVAAGKPVGLGDRKEITPAASTTAP
jgi:general stress protein 26